jgi:glycosyltransferase involved in cell wall biosynthesis
MLSSLTVAICTRNRARILGRTLESLGVVEPPKGVEWEVLVVDNGSTDDTADVLGRMDSRLPLRSVVEDEPGLSTARNRAVEEARGEYIIWIDDDVQLSGNFLTAYADAFSDHPEGAVFGGPIEPWFEETPPTWVRETLDIIGHVYALRDLGSEVTPLAEEGNRMPYGANYAIRTEIQRGFPYDPALGRRGNVMLHGEEIAVIQAVLRAGHGGWWVPEARVRHWIPKTRMTKEHVRRYAEGLGVGWETKRRRSREREVPMLFGRPRYLFRAIIEAYLSYLMARALSNERVWVKAMWEAAVIRGRLRSYQIP